MGEERVPNPGADDAGQRVEVRNFTRAALPMLVAGCRNQAREGDRGVRVGREPNFGSRLGVPTAPRDEAVLGRKALEDRIGDDSPVGRAPALDVDPGNGFEVALCRFPNRRYTLRRMTSWRSATGADG